MSNELTDVRCPCGDEYPADSYDAGFIAGSGMCQNCDAALPPKDICTCPSGDGSLRHPCPEHPAVEQAGGDERDFQAEGAQEVPSPVSQEYDRHLISLLRKGEALPGHQEEAADEIERLRDWNDHLNNTVLPNILNPNFLMLMKGGERLLDLCTKDGKFIGVSLNDMKDVFDWMVTHARIAPDHAALAQPSQAIAAAPTYQFQSREIGESDWAPCDFRWYLYCSKSPEMDTRVVEVAAQPSPAQAEQAEAERPEVVAVVRAQGFGRVCEADANTLYQHCSDGDEMMTVAQHERIVKAWIERWKAYIELSAKIAAQRDAANARLHEVATACATAEQERDAALARVAELERQEPVDVPGPDEIHQMAFEEGQPAEDGDGYLFSAEEFDLFVQRLLDSCAAPVARAQHSVPIAPELKRALGLVVAALEADGDRPTSKYALSELKKVIAAAPGKEVPQAWLDVQAERRRQITAEGWTPEHDDLYCAAELPRAAAAYILNGANDEAPAIWPFSAKWWKPRDARANYVRAAALILAEIERLDRAAPGKDVGHE